VVAKKKKTASKSTAAKSTRKTKVVEVDSKSSPRLLLKYRDEVMSPLTKEFNYTSTMQVPRLVKISINIGLGEATTNAKEIENAMKDLELITGQHPVTTKARKSVAGFKVREGMVVGTTVTLRSRRMYEFFDKLVSSTLPRIRDFRGLPRGSFDGRGNYSIGIREQVIFPEIDYNSVDRIRSLQIVIVTSASTDHEGLRLLDLMGMPFAQTASSHVAA
jgi:large subunit ribosomal protein L5